MGNDFCSQKQLFKGVPLINCLKNIHENSSQLNGFYSTVALALNGLINQNGWKKYFPAEVLILI